MIKISKNIDNPADTETITETMHIPGYIMFLIILGTTTIGLLASYQLFSYYVSQEQTSKEYSCLEEGHSNEYRNLEDQTKEQIQPKMTQTMIRDMIKIMSTDKVDEHEQKKQ